MSFSLILNILHYRVVETPVLWPPDVKSWLIGKDSDAGREWGQEEKGTTEDEMAGWHHWLDGLESQWTPGAGDGQGGLACCDSWGHKESDMTERLIWSVLIPRSPRNSQESSPTPEFESISSSVLSFIYGPTSSLVFCIFRFTCSWTQSPSLSIHF